MDEILEMVSKLAARMSGQERQGFARSLASAAMGEDVAALTEAPAGFPILRLNDRPGPAAVRMTEREAAAIRAMGLNPARVASLPETANFAEWKKASGGAR